jgi:hypothetical protein
MNEQDSKSELSVTNPENTSESSTDRREFLTAVTAAVAAGTVGGLATGAQAQGTFQATPMNSMRAGAMTRAGAQRFIVSRNAADVRQVRLSSAGKSFEQLTVSELTQLRPGGDSAAAGYTVQVETNTVTVNGSSVLFNLMNERGLTAVQAEGAKLAPGAQINIAQ